MNMAPAPKLLVFMSLAPELSFFKHGSSFCSFLHINIFNCLGGMENETYQVHKTKRISKLISVC